MEENVGCHWLCEGYPPDMPEDWYPDSPSDLVYECGAPVTDTEYGWRCEAGHSYDRRDNEPYGLYYQLGL